MKNLKANYHKIMFLFFTFLLLYSCKQSSQSELDNYVAESSDTVQSSVVMFGNTVFSLPSPYEIAYLVKKLNVPYNKEYLNPHNKSHNYVTSIEKALNLGIYGCDLGYLTLYDQSSDAIHYFSVIKLLSQELNIENAFDKKTVDRIEANIGNKDSLMVIVSNSYRKADEYLKNNARMDIAALILTGGWIESTYILTQIIKQNKNQEIINRLGEQKYPLDNLIKILSPFYNQSKEIAELTDNLIDLAYDFDGIDIKYTYAPPTIDTVNKLTIINSKSEVIINDVQIKLITEKIEKIRKKIVK
ncbi:MAG: hypothetical protein N3A01_01355 [Bacteroidales bacterium]|nr:hypothetical protein [Bacteroidales bacterium]